MTTYKLILVSFEDTLYGVWLLHEITSKCSLHQISYIHTFQWQFWFILIRKLFAIGLKKNRPGSEDNRWAGIFPKGIAWGVGPKVLVTNSLKAFFCHLSYKVKHAHVRGGQNDNLVSTLCLTQSDPPPFEKCWLPLFPSLLPVSLVFRPFTVKWFSYSCMVGSGYEIVWVYLTYTSIL